MNGRFVGVALLLLTGGCGAEPEAETPETAPVAPAPRATEAAADPYAACGRDANPGVCADSVEARLLASAGEVRRSGDTLWITGADGSTLPLVSGYPAELPMSFRYAGFLPLLGHGIEVGHYEGSEFLLVDSATTQQTTLIGRPLLSPQGTRFVTSSLDLVAGYNPNGVQIWSLRGHAPVIEWELRGGSSWGASNPRWVDESTVDFTLHRPLPDRTTSSETQMRITIGSDGIHVDPVTN